MASVPVLAEGRFDRCGELLKYLGDSCFITEDHGEVLRMLSEREGLDPDRVRRETDPSRQMEGLYFKVEQDGEVKSRFKYVRASFAQCVDASGSHWLDRSIVPNRLRGPVEDLFVPGLRAEDGGGDNGGAG